MSRHRVVGIAGNLKRPSRTRALVEAVAAVLAQQREVDLSVYDLIDAGPGLGAAYGRGELTPEAGRVVEAVETADALIVGTPVYKGSYTGLFKHLFDLVDPGALSDKPVVLTATGGGPRHALVVEHQLRPLFGFFTALIVPTAVYASDQDFRGTVLAEADTLERAATAARQLARFLGAPERAPVPANGSGHRTRALAHGGIGG
jgi:FMN reductase